MAQCRTTTWNIPYDMLHMNGTGYTEEWNPQLVNSSFYAMVDWDESTRFVQDMLGRHFQSPNGTIQRNLPNQHPYFPFLWCVGCALVVGYGKPTADHTANNSLFYDKAVYKCTFAGVPYDVVPDDEARRIDAEGEVGELSRYVVRDFELAGESIQGTGQFKFLSSSNPVPTPPAVMTAYGKFKYKWYYVPDPILGLMDTAVSCYGTVNSGYFDGLYFNLAFGPETLLYLGMELERIAVSPTSITNPSLGNRMWNVTHLFAYRRQTWNKAIDFRVGAPPDNCWDTVISIPLGHKPYATKNFNNLFSLS